VGRIFVLGLFLTAAILGRASGDKLIPRLPAPRPAAYSEFYTSLRESSVTTSRPEAAGFFPDAGRRLALLTEQLPESLPLRTPANTVLIVHRKNPKYRESIERLLWRRLDPALATLAGSDELQGALTRVATELRPLCGDRSDSVRMELEGIYESTTPPFLATAWPSLRQTLLAGIRGATDPLLPHEGNLLADLGRLLAVPIPDTSRVSILAVTATVPAAARPPVLHDGRARVVVTIRPEDAHANALDLLCAYVTACDALAPPNSATALRLVSSPTPGKSDRPSPEMPRALLRYAISKELQALYGWNDVRALPADSTLAAACMKNWNAYAAGGISLATACAAIVAESSGEGK
jgi:hypothetical protein